MVIDWPEDLISAIARRHSVLFLGAGVSRQATNHHGRRPETWSGFLEAALIRAGGTKHFHDTVKTLLKQRDYLLACQIIKDKMGTAAFHALMRDHYLTPRFQHAPIHDKIIELDSRIVATPNFDKIYETRVNAVQNSSVAVKHYYDKDIAEIIRTAGRVVIKIHGTIDTPAKMIFTRSEYAKARQEYRDFYGILEALAVAYTFVFVGCGLYDPDMQLLLEDYCFKYAVSAPHYFVLPKGYLRPHTEQAIQSSLNIHILSYDPRNDHVLLATAIEELGALVAAKRTELLLTHDW